MRLEHTFVNEGGLFRCCLQTIESLNPFADYKDGMVIDCQYEPSGNRRIILQDGVWKWNCEDIKVSKDPIKIPENG